MIEENKFPPVFKESHISTKSNEGLYIIDQGVNGSQTPKMQNKPLSKIFEHLDYS